MRKWFLITGAGAVVGYAVVYFALSGGQPSPEPVPEQATAPAPAEPVMLGHVVEVTDLDPLLNPPPETSAGVPFDPTEPLEPPTPGAAPIPPASEESDEDSDRQGVAPRVDSGRAVWYGSSRLPRQIHEWGGGLRENSGPYYCPSGFVVGIAFSF